MHTSQPTTFCLCFCCHQSHRKNVLFSSQEERFCNDIRQLQRRTKCTEATVVDFLATFEKYLKCPTAGVMARSLRKHDKKMQERAGVHFLILNGCTKCDKFVYLPEDKRTVCPYVSRGKLCGARRFHLNGKPKEVCLLLLIN